VSQTLRPRTLFISACAGILVFGIVLAILGTVFGLPEMRARLHIDLAQQGNLILLLYLGIFCSSLLVGPLIDRFGNKANLCVSSAIAALAMIAFAAAHSYAAASLAAVLLGLGGGGLNTCTNALVSDVYGDQRGPMLNLLGIFFGIGALFVPLLAAGLEEHFTIAQLFLFCSVLSATCALAYGAISFPPAKAAQVPSWRELPGVARYEGILLLAFILFFESGNEACIGGWTSTYVGATGHSPRTATLVLAAYWAALMMSRILAAQLLKICKKSQMVLVAALISAAGCTILLSARSLPMLFGGTAVIGLSYGPIFPTTLAIAGDRYSKMAGTVFGFLFSIALLGGMLFPWAAGQMSQRVSVHAGMIVPALGAAGIALSAIAVMVRERNSTALSESNAPNL
jgi:FHS family glucose/mannose:H+ symporter-like MFS transporter